MSGKSVAKVSVETGVNRFTLAQAAKQGRLGNAAKREGRFWLIDVEHEDYKKWVEAHQYQPRVKGAAKKRGL